MRHSTRTFGAAFGLLAAAVLSLAGCSSTSASTPAAAAPYAASPSATSAGASAASMVTATETEFSIALSQTTFAPGTYTFTVANQGKFPHNLTVEGPGVDKQASPTLKAGESGSVTVTLQAGTYDLSCSVPGHKDRGMDLKITVS